MGRLRWHGTLAAFLASTTLGVAPDLAAMESSLALGYELRTTDNVLLVPEEAGPQEDYVHSPTVDVGLLLEEPRTTVEADYRWQGRYFQKGSVRDDNVLSGTSSILYQAIPGRLLWDAGHTRTQQLLNVRLADNPLNQQEFDTLTTGLDYRFLVSGPHDAGVQARAFRMVTSGFGVDSTRFTLGTNYERELSETSAAGVFADYTDVEFDEAFVPPFWRATGGVSVRRSGPRFRLSARAGLNRVDRQGIGSNDGWLLDGSLVVQLTQSQTLSLEARRELSDQTQFLAQGRLGFGNLRDQGQFAAVFELTGLGARYDFSRDRWRLSLDANLRRQDFGENSPQSDIERRNYRAALYYRLTPTVATDVAFNWLEQDFEGTVGGLVAREDEQFRVDAFLRWTPGSRTNVSAGVGYWDSDSSADFFRFEETSFIVEFRRQLLGRR